jgi:hypothetical protein
MKGLDDDDLLAGVREHTRRRGGRDATTLLSNI